MNSKSIVKKSLLILFAITTVFIILFYTLIYSKHFTLEEYYRRVFVHNSIELTCKGLDIKEIEVNCGFDPLIYEGIVVGKISYNYGSTTFGVTIYDSVKFGFEHVKLDDWRPHKYKIHIIKNESVYYARFSAEGYSPTHTVCLYDSTGKLTNMIEEPGKLYWP